MSNYIECKFTEITQVNRQNVVIGCIYRPPSINKESLNLFISNFTDIIGVIDCGKRKTVLLASDYNIDFLKCDSHGPTVNFLEILLSHSYIPAIKFPTRVAYHSATLIDNIHTNSLPDRVDSFIIYNDISDHYSNAIQ